MDPNKNVVMWLLIFPPIGLVRIWTISTWSKRKKVLITVFVIVCFALSILTTVAPVWYVEHIFSAY